VWGNPHVSRKALPGGGFFVYMNKKWLIKFIKPTKKAGYPA
jgi:hypothetical protein